MERDGKEKQTTVCCFFVQFPIGTHQVSSRSLARSQMTSHVRTLQLLLGLLRLLVLLLVGIRITSSLAVNDERQALNPGLEDRQGLDSRGGADVNRGSQGDRGTTQTLVNRGGSVDHGRLLVDRRLVSSRGEDLGDGLDLGVRTQMDSLTREAGVGCLGRVDIGGGGLDFSLVGG